MNVGSMNTPNKPQTHEPNKSKFFIKSIGYAAMNLPYDSDSLEVYPAEEFGYADGEITDQRESHEEVGIDAHGNSYQDSIQTSTTIKAQWLPWGSHRFAAPNVRRGERVLLWQYADEDKYYWTTMGMDDHLRRLETAVFQFSNTKDESVKKLDSTNTYSVIVSTHSKEFTIQTSKSDGEQFEYTIRLDAKNNYFAVTDDTNNQITIESDKKRVTLHNADGCSVVLDKKDVIIEAVNNFSIKAKTVSIESSGATTMNVGKFGMLGGVMDLGGSRLVVGNGATFNGTITNNGVNIGSTHVHPGVKSGGDTSSTPK